MPKFESKAEFEDRKANGGGDFSTLAEGEYVFEIKDVFPDKFTPNQYNETGEVIVLDLDVIEDAEDPDADVLGTDGKPLDPNTWVRFNVTGTFDKPKGLGFGSAGPGKARRVIASALAQNVNDSIELSPDWKELVGGRFIASTTVSDSGWIRWETVRAYKKKKKDRVEERPKADLTKAAADIFKDDVAGEDDLPF